MTRKNNSQSLYRFVQNSLEVSEKIVPLWNLFLDFLESQGALHKYFANYFTDTIRGYSGKLILERGTIWFWVRAAFNWEDTPEGKDYWSKIAKEWYTHLTKIKQLCESKKEEYLRLSQEIASLTEKKEKMEKEKLSDLLDFL